MSKTHFPRQGPAYQWVQSFYTPSFPDAGVVGNIIYVNSVTGTDSTSFGFSPEAPCATIAYAVATLATADNNDLILVMPGHIETIVAAAGVAMSKAGVTVRGLGNGRQRGKVIYTTSTGASFDITAARCCIDNLTFVGTGIDALTAMINVTAADVTIKNCEIEHGNASAQATLGILTSALADRLNIDNCFFHGTTDAGTTCAISLVGGNEITITNCRIYGSYTSGVGGIQGATTDSLNLTIKGCNIVNRTASSTKVIALTASTTGSITDCRLGILSGSAPITAAGIDLVGGNYYKAAAGVSAGTLL